MHGLEATRCSAVLHALPLSVRGDTTGPADTRHTTPVPRAICRDDLQVLSCKQLAHRAPNPKTEKKIAPPGPENTPPARRLFLSSSCRSPQKHKRSRSGAVAAAAPSDLGASHPQHAPLSLPPCLYSCNL